MLLKVRSGSMPKKFSAELNVFSLWVWARLLYKAYVRSTALFGICTFFYSFGNIGRHLCLLLYYKLCVYIWLTAIQTNTFTKSKILFECTRRRRKEKRKRAEGLLCCVVQLWSLQQAPRTTSQHVGRIIIITHNML